MSSVVALARLSQKAEGLCLLYTPLRKGIRAERGKRHSSGPEEILRPGRGLPARNILRPGTAYYAVVNRPVPSRCLKTSYIMR